MADKKKGIIYLVLTALFYGLAGVCVKSISWSSLSIICVRSIISLFMLYFYYGKKHLSFTKTNILGAICMSLCGILYVVSIKLTTAGTAIVLQYIAPILVFLYAVIFQKKKVKPYEAILTFVVFCGCVLSFLDSIDMSHILGNVLALLSGFAYAAQLIIMNSSKSDSQDVMIMSNAMCFLICLPFMFMDQNLSFDLTNVIWVLILSIFQYGVANILMSKGIKLVDKLEGSLILTIEPIFNPIPVALICHEKMGFLALLGSFIVIAGTALYTYLSRND